MLNTMGTPQERRQIAYNKARTSTQNLRTPSELLTEMKEYWDELDESDQSTMMMQFRSALDSRVVHRLDLSLTPFPNIDAMEEAANRHWRAIQKERADRKETKDNKRGRSDTTADRDSSGKKTQSSARPFVQNVIRAVKDSPGPERPLKCWGCQQPGHKKPDCPNKHLWASKDEPPKDSPAP